MLKPIKTIVAATVMAGFALSGIAQERAEQINAVHMLSQPTCPLSARSSTDTETAGTKELFGAAIAMALGGIAGDLVKSGLTAAGDALEQVSKEKGFVAEGYATVPLLHLSNRTETGKTARLDRLSPCLILYSDGTTGEISKLGEEKQIKDLQLNDEVIKAAVKVLENGGVKKVPSLYIEALVLSYPEGIVIRPALVWYREKLPGAPSKAAAAELHVVLAVPGASDLGTTFSAARMSLPKIAPGNIAKWDELGGFRSPMLLPRPTAGFVETKLATANTSYASEVTRQKEKLVAGRTLEAAKGRHNAKPTDDTAAALQAATNAMLDADKAVTEAENEAAQVKSADIGNSNIKMRFVVVRRPDQFGLALAKALKGQAEATGKAVTDGLKSKPDWTTADTAYLTAQIAVDTKQREYDAAVAAGDSAAIAKLAGELVLAKAKLNEAAAGSNRPVPYPSLLP